MNNQKKKELIKIKREKNIMNGESSSSYSTFAFFEIASKYYPTPDLHSI